MKSTAFTFICIAFLAAFVRADESPYAAWKHGPSADPSFFPIAVWLQEPSNDVYPMANPGLGASALWLVPQGVDRLRRWTGGGKPIWNCIECSNINGQGKATPHEVKAEVWMSLIHGSRGIIYFVHQFKPKFDEHALLDDPEMLKGVTQINQQIHDLAPVLNSATIPAAASASASDGEFPVDLIVKRHDAATYIFSVEMRNRPTKVTIRVPGVKDGAAVQVIGEDRRMTVHEGVFEDNFEPYDVHLYRLDVR